MKEKIMLLVDDFEANRAVLAECFCKDFTILHADGGHQAIRLIEEYGARISVILLDMLLSDMDGIAVLKWLKASVYTAIPIIAVAAEPNDQLEALENGAWDFIVKSEDSRVIRARVNNVLGRRTMENGRRYREQIAKDKLEIDHLVNSIPGGIATYRVTDQGLETIYFSDGVAALTGHTREEYAERVRGDATAIIYGKDRRRLLDSAVATLKSGQAIDETYRIYHKNGSLVWVRLNGVMIGEEHGVPILHAVFQRPAQMAQLYGNLVNESQNIIYVTDVNTYDLLYVNQTGLKELGKKTAAYAGKKCYEFLFGQSAPCVFCKQDCMRADRYCVRDFTYPKTGKIYSLRGKLTDWNGLSAHVEYIADVTEARKAEQQNAALTAQLQSVMENIPGGMCVYRVDENGVSPLVHNQAFFALFGYSEAHRKAVQENTSFLNVHPDDLGELRDKTIAAIEANTRLNHTYRLFHDAQNRYVWLNLNAVVVPQSDGTKLCYASYSDVTAERETQESLIQTQRVLDTMRRKAQNALDSYQLLVNTVPGGIAQYEIKDGKILTRFFSDGMCELTGYARDEREQMNSKDVLAVTYPADLPLLSAAIEDAVAKQGDLSITYRMNTKSGEPRWVHLNAAYSPGAHGECLYQAVYTDVDTRKRLEQELRDNQLRYEAAIKGSGINIWEYDIGRDSLYIVSNSSRIKQNCYSIDHYTQSTLDHGYVREDSIPAFLRIFERLRQGEREITEDIWYKTTDRTGWWCERVTYTAVFDDAGKPQKAFGAGRDVTREKEAEQKFQEEVSYRKTIQRDNLASATLDLTDDRVLEISSSFSVVSDLGEGTANQYFAQTAKLLVGEECAKKYSQLYTKQNLLDCFDKGEYTQSMELTRCFDTDRIYWVSYSAHMLQDPATKHILAYISGIDITSEKVMQTIMENIVKSDYDSFAVVDGSFDSALDYGVEPGKNLYDPLESFEAQIEALIRRSASEEDVDRVVSACKIDHIWPQIKDGGTYRFSFGMRMPDGEVRRKQLQFTAISSPRKTFLMSCIDVNDIYQEQQTAKDMLKSALVAAEQANSAKSDFLSRMSHEIRTPMNAIIGMAAIAAQSIGDDTQIADCISKIGISSRFLLSLINDILDMSRIESGKMLLKNEKIPFEEFINGINSICYTQAQAKNIDYENIVNSGVEDYYIGDAMKLQQVLINILSNAIKFTPEGGRVVLQVRQVKKTKSNAVLRFSVNDTGCGISEEFIPHLFEAFSQAHSGTTSAYGGTGLGLSICKHLVNMMDGHITVRSIEGAGSEFTVEVKLGITEESKTRYLKKQQYNFAELKALVVDDDVTVCEHTVITLKEIGVKSEWVDSGRKAVRRVQEKWENKEYYDLILVDWKMPDMDGIETAGQIRKIVGPDVTIIIMTAYDWVAIEHDARQAGVNLLMSKPMFKSSLISVFEKAFGGKQEEEAARLKEEFLFEGKRVLLAEDHPLNVEIAKKLLERRGFAVEHAENGLRAMELFAASPVGYYDAILMDIRMPEMDGLQAAYNIRHWRKEDAKTIPIIAMTANAFEDDIEKSKAAGMNAHLAKPIEPKQLFQTLFDFIYKNKANGAE